MGSCPGGKCLLGSCPAGSCPDTLILTSQKKRASRALKWALDPVNENPGSALGGVSLEDTDENGQFSHFTESKCNIKKKKTRRAVLNAIMYIVLFSLTSVLYTHLHDRRHHQRLEVR